MGSRICRPPVKKESRRFPISKVNFCMAIHVTDPFLFILSLFSLYTFIPFLSPLNSQVNGEAWSDIFIGMLSSSVQWILQNQTLQTCASTWPLPSQLHLRSTLAFTLEVHASFYGRPSASRHFSETLWLQSPTLCHGTVNIYTIIKIASTFMSFLLLSFNTFL